MMTLQNLSSLHSMSGTPSVFYMLFIWILFENTYKRWQKVLKQLSSIGTHMGRIEENNTNLQLNFWRHFISNNYAFGNISYRFSFHPNTDMEVVVGWLVDCFVLQCINPFRVI